MKKPTVIEDPGGANWLTPEGQRPKGRRTSLRVMLALDEANSDYLFKTAKTKKLSPQRLVQTVVERILERQQLLTYLDDDNDK